MDFLASREIEPNSTNGVWVLIRTYMMWWSGYDVWFCCQRTKEWDSDGRHAATSCYTAAAEGNLHLSDLSINEGLFAERAKEADAGMLSSLYLLHHSSVGLFCIISASLTISIIHKLRNSAEYYSTVIRRSTDTATWRTSSKYNVVGKWYEHMTSSIKPKIPNVSQRRQWITEPRPQAKRTK